MMVGTITFLMDAREAAKRLGRHKTAGSGFKASCPVPNHGKGRGDLRPSLTLDDDGNSRILVHCKAGCTQEDVLDALIAKGIAARDDGDYKPSSKSRNLVKTPDQKQEKPADEWESVPLNTPGAPDLDIPAVLIRAGVLEKMSDGLVLLERDAEQPFTSPTIFASRCYQTLNRFIYSLL